MTGVFKLPVFFRFERANQAKIEKRVEELERKFNTFSKAPEPQSDPDKSKPALYCSFCGKSQHDVMKLIAQPPHYICSECVALCVDIICGAQKGGDA